MTDNKTPARRMRHGERPEQPLYFGPETGQARRWPALITSAGHGMLQEYGTKFEYAQPGQEVLEVMEILPGAANKAAEEGGLLDELVKVIAHWKCDSCGGIGHDGESHYQGHFQPPEPYPCSDCQGAGLQREEFCNKAEIGAFISQFSAIAADRASRQVANKAEVEPIGYVNGDELDNMLDDRTATIQSARSGWRATPVYATPPATTGASTGWVKLNDVQWMNIVNHDHAYESYSKDEAVHEAVKRTEVKLKELNAAPVGASTARNQALEEAIAVCEAIHADRRDAYKGRGKYAPNNPERADTHCDGEGDGALRCVEAIEALKGNGSVGASTVLTDERIAFEAAYIERVKARDPLRSYSEEEISTHLARNSNNESRYLHAQEAWEGWQARAKVAAQAGQVAPAKPLAMVSPSELRDIQAGRGGVPVRGNQWRADQTVPIYAAPVAGQVAVPEDWKLMPRKPSQEHVAEAAYEISRKHASDIVTPNLVRMVYETMIYALPPSPAKESK